MLARRQIPASAPPAAEASDNSPSGISLGKLPTSSTWAAQVNGIDNTTSASSQITQLVARCWWASGSSRDGRRQAAGVLPLRQIAVGENALVERMDNAFLHKPARVSNKTDRQNAVPTRL